MTIPNTLNMNTVQAVKGTQTEENLMRAFAGESQARNRYTFAASKAKNNNLHVVEAIFTFTANQEKEHAEIFYDYLKGSSGNTVFIDGGYPIDLYDDAYSLLAAAQHNEYEEYDDVYKTFGDVAEREGFMQIAQTFRNIASIEKTHGDRFGYYAQLIKENKLFVMFLHLFIIIHFYKKSCHSKNRYDDSRHKHIFSIKTANRVNNIVLIPIFLIF